MQTLLRITLVFGTAAVVVALVGVPMPVPAETLAPFCPDIVLECPRVATALVTIPGLPHVLVPVPVHGEEVAYFDATLPLAAGSSSGRLVPLQFPPELAPYIVPLGTR